MGRERELDAICVGVEPWRDWRLVSHGLTWRVAVPADQAAISLLHDAMEQAYSLPVDRPNPFAPPVMLTLVAEDEVGNIVDALFVEAVAHIAKATNNRRSYAAFPALLPVVGGFLAERNYRLASMSVPNRWSRVMRPSLEAMKFRSTCGTYTHFFRSVR